MSDSTNCKTNEVKANRLSPCAPEHPKVWTEVILGNLWSNSSHVSSCLLPASVFLLGWLKIPPKPTTRVLLVIVQEIIIMNPNPSVHRSNPSTVLENCLPSTGVCFGNLSFTAVWKFSVDGIHWCFIRSMPLCVGEKQPYSADTVIYRAKARMSDCSVFFEPVVFFQLWKIDSSPLRSKR